MTDSFAHAGNADQAAYWNGPGGRHWTARQEMQDAILAPISEILIEAAGAAPGERALDIGCGCGATTFDLAARLAPGGQVIGLDISAPMLERAQARTLAGLPATFVVGDATVHKFAAGWADLLISRFGVMFFADPALSFANMRKGLAPGGRVVFACWREPRDNPWLMLPLREAYKHVPRLPDLSPEDPGPFAFADPERVRAILLAAGFVDIVLTRHDLRLDIAAGKGFEAAMATTLEIGPTSRALDGQPEALQRAAAAAIREALQPYRQGQGVWLGASIWIVSARNP